MIADLVVAVADDAVVLARFGDALAEQAVRGVIDILYDSAARFFFDFRAVAGRVQGVAVRADEAAVATPIFQRGQAVQQVVAVFGPRAVRIADAFQIADRVVAVAGGAGGGGLTTVPNRFRSS